MCKLPFNWSVPLKNLNEICRKPVTCDVNNSVSRECLLCNNSQKGKQGCPNTAFNSLAEIFYLLKSVSQI